MKLGDWMKQNRWSTTAFADKIGCHRVSLSGYLHGHTRFGRSKAKLIEIITEGAVTEQEVISENRLKNK